MRAGPGFFSICYPGFFTRSTDSGDSYEPCIEIPDNPYWGTLAVAPGSGFNPSGTLYAVGASSDDFVVARSSNARYAGQANIATAASTDPQGHAVYVLCSVNPPGNDPLDVMFARSNDSAVNWSAPVRVNDDAGNAWQWFGTMSTSPSGRIDAVWLDTRDHPGTYLSSLYYSFSTDGGVTWSANERLSEAFDPHVGWPNQNKLGDSPARRS